MLANTTQFGVIGDVHANMNTPASRLDSYPDTIIRKLSDTRKVLRTRGIHHAIQLGDLWHANTQSSYYINQVCEELQQWRDDGIELHVITGNHEMANEKPENVARSPLQILYTTGLAKHLKHLQLERVAICGYDYTDPIREAPKTKLYKVCVAHRFYENSLSDQSLKERNIQYLNYNLYILGHDHVKYEPLVLPSGQVIQRPGSLARGTSHSYQLTREPSFDIDTVTYDPETGQFHLSIETITLPHAPASEVFTIQALKKPAKTEDLTQLSAQIDALIDSMDQTQTSSSVYTILDKMEMDERTRKLIETYLTNAGIYRPSTQT